MLSSTRSSTGNHYIVVLDVAADVVRALLFDSEARRVEGYSAQLPRRPEAAADCLDEMHRLVEADGFPVDAVVGRTESELTAEDRESWPAFAEARWLPALPDGCGAVLGSGCISRDRFALVAGDRSMVATVVEGVRKLPEGISWASLSSKTGKLRRLIYSAVPEADGVYAALKHALKVKGSLEGYIENADAQDPHLAPLLAAGRRFAEVYQVLCDVAGKPCEVIAGGSALLKSPAWTQRIANELGASLTLSTEPEPACRGAALWALEQVGVIEDMATLPASTAAVYAPGFLENK